MLRYIADQPQTQVASATGISETAVKAYTARAMSLLREPSCARPGRRRLLAGNLSQAATGWVM